MFAHFIVFYAKGQKRLLYACKIFVQLTLQRRQSDHICVPTLESLAISDHPVRLVPVSWIFLSILQWQITGSNPNFDRHNYTVVPV